jgi:hypothetical protein
VFATLMSAPGGKHTLAASLSDLHRLAKTQPCHLNSLIVRYSAEFERMAV